MSRVKLLFKKLKQRITGPILVLLFMLGLFLLPMTGLADTAVKWALPVASNPAIGGTNGGGELQILLKQSYFISIFILI